MWRFFFLSLCWRLFTLLVKTKVLTSLAPLTLVIYVLSRSTNWPLITHTIEYKHLFDSPLLDCLPLLIRRSSLSFSLLSFAFGQNSCKNWWICSEYTLGLGRLHQLDLCVRPFFSSRHANLVHQRWSGECEDERPQGKIRQTAASLSLSFSFAFLFRFLSPLSPPLNLHRSLCFSPRTTIQSIHWHGITPVHHLTTLPLSLSLSTSLTSDSRWLRKPQSRTQSVIQWKPFHSIRIHSSHATNPYSHFFSSSLSHYIDFCKNIYIFFTWLLVGPVFLSLSDTL